MTPSPALTRFAAMGAPMLPRPMKPMVAMSQHLRGSEAPNIADRGDPAAYSPFASSMSLAIVLMLRAVGSTAAWPLVARAQQSKVPIRRRLLEVGRADSIRGPARHSFDVAMRYGSSEAI